MLSNSFRLFGFHVFSGLIAPDESYSRNSSCLLNLIDLRSYYYNWVNTFADGLLVPEGVIRPVVSVSTLSWCALKLISTFLLDMSHCTLTPKSIGGSRRGWAGGGDPLWGKLQTGNMCFNRIFPISSLSFFFLHCFIIFALNYASVSFDFSQNKLF